MEIVIDTSVIIAVLLREPHRSALIRATVAADLPAPPSVHWEIGNAFSAMFKRRRLSLRAARRALEGYGQIPIRYSEVNLNTALEVAHDLGVDAYDAYVIACALQHRCTVLSLDQRLTAAAARAGVRTMETSA